MPLGQANIEKEEKTYPLRPETPSNVEMPPRKLEVVPPPRKEGEIKQDGETDIKIEVGEKRTVTDQGGREVEKQTKTIEQLGAELIETVNSVPKGGDVDMRQVEEKCTEVVNSIMGDGDKSPERIKEELITFAEEYFKNYSSIGFIITELFRIAGQKINTPRY